MRKLIGISLLMCAVFLWTGVSHSIEPDEAKVLIDKAIKAAGGEKNLKKHQAATWTEKGTYYGLGEGVPYVGKLAAQHPGQFRMQVFAGDMELFTLVLNKDKGWNKSPGGTKEIPKDELKKQQFDQKAGWIATLLPLQGPGFALAMIEGVDVDKKPTVAVKVTHKDCPEVKLYFDKQSSMLVKSQSMVFSNEQKKEVLAEVYYQNYKLIDGAQVPTRIVLKHDGKLFVETDIHDSKAAGELDNSVFAAPK